eukprot:UN1973
MGKWQPPPRITGTRNSGACAGTPAMVKGTGRRGRVTVPLDDRAVNATELHQNHDHHQHGYGQDRKRNGKNHTAPELLEHGGGGKNDQEKQAQPHGIARCQVHLPELHYWSGNPLGQSSALTLIGQNPVDPRDHPQVGVVQDRKPHREQAWRNAQG